LSNDCRTIEEEAAKGHPGAKLALEMFIYRLAKYIGSMTVAAGGLDALVFTGGIGENSDIIRERVLGYLGFLGLHIDQEANLKGLQAAQTGSIVCNHQFFIGRNHNGNSFAVGSGNHTGIAEAGFQVGFLVNVQTHDTARLSGL
jgi:hypothetical protein